MQRLYFMRHGLSVHNKLGIFNGRTSSPLTEMGRQQVRKSAEAVKKLNIDKLVSSPSIRTLESAQIIADIIGYPTQKILVNDLFAERDFGMLENTVYLTQSVHDEIRGIETIDQIIKRAEKALAWLNQLKAENILVVSHASLGRALRYVVSDNIPFDYPAPLKNAELASLI